MELQDRIDRALAKVAGDPAATRRLVESHPAVLLRFMGWDVAAHHQRALDEMLRHPRFFWLAPRGSGKSTAALFMAVWLVLSDPANRAPGIPDLFPDAPREITPGNIRIALTSNSSARAEELHWQAKAILTDAKITELYGDLMGTRWQQLSSTTSLRTTQMREGTLTAMGLGSKVTGGHYDVILVDDWVTEDNARTASQRQRLEKFWQMTVRPTLEPWGRAIGAGTRYHSADWYDSIHRQAEDGLWHLRRDAAVQQTDEGRISYWPKAYSLEQLDQIAQEIGAVAFDTQYQNEVGLLRGEFFQAEWLDPILSPDRFLDPEKPQDYSKARTVIALDPAIKGGKRNDYSVFTVTSFTGFDFHVRKVIRGQWTQRELVERAQLLCQEYRPKMLGVEVVGGIEFLAQELKRHPRMSRVEILRPTSFRGRDKVGRASHVRKFFEQGRVKFAIPTASNGIQRCLDECMAFPTKNHEPGWDDCVDSLVWSLLLMTRNRTRVVQTGGF